MGGRELLSFKEYSSIQVDIKVDWKIKWVILFYICFVKKAKIIIFFWIYIWISRRKKEEGKKKRNNQIVKIFYFKYMSKECCEFIYFVPELIYG